MRESQPSPPSASAATPAPRRRRGRGCLVLCLVLLLLAGGLALYLWGALRYSYASGERAGYVQKLSKKGWLCKTWEGELAMANLPGAMPEVFAFSVRDDAVARQLNESIGQRVAISYQQHKGLPTTCFGETEYFVTGVRRVGQSDPAGQAMPAMPPVPASPASPPGS